MKRDCPDCSAGYSRTYELLRPHINALVWSFGGMKDAGYKQVTTFLCERYPRDSFGHDSIDAHAAIKKLGDLAGLPEGWDTCPTCDGSAEVETTISEAHN